MNGCFKSSQEDLLFLLLCNLCLGFLLFFVFLGLHLQRMEVPRLGVELELPHSHSNAGSEPHLRPTPQLMDP